jgi:DNA-binding transcriptional LysR family regulator
MNNIKQLPKLMIFATVVKHGSFTGAAKELGLSKSAVSQQIKSLEEELDIRVLNRTTRGISTTALGEKLLSRCQILRDQVDLVLKDIATAEENPKGRFAITLPHSLEENVVMPAIEQLCNEFPGLEPELIVTDSRLDLVENNLDVALHAGELPDSSYRALPVGTITEIFCATPLYLNRTLTPKKLADLSQLKWIATSWQKVKMPVYDSCTQEKKIIQLTQFAKANTFPTVVSMALRHLGMVILPDYVAKPLINTGELVQLMDKYIVKLWPLHTIHAYQGEKPIHLTRFHQLVCNHFRDLLK